MRVWTIKCVRDRGPLSPLVSKVPVEFKVLAENIEAVWLWGRPLQEHHGYRIIGVLRGEETSTLDGLPIAVGSLDEQENVYTRRQRISKFFKKLFPKQLNA